MAANELDITQISSILNSVVKQATGRDALTPTNTSEFVAVATTALKTGHDTLLNAISQVLSYTIFSQRPYSRKFGGIEVSNQRYGNMVRKLNIADKDFEEDQRQKLIDGQSVDMYKVNKPNILQTNFYGQSVYQKHITVFRDQLDVAFSSPGEFASFVSMVLINTTDLLEQARENLARATIANFIAGKIAGDSRNVIHLVTEYNAAAGTTLTPETIFQDGNYKPFISWAYSRVESLSKLMTERSNLFQVNITNYGGTYNPGTGTATGGVDKTISRHTPRNKQKVYLFSPTKVQIEKTVLADIYHDNYLKLTDNEEVNFWQSIETPDELIVKPTYTVPTGELVTPENNIDIKNLFGVIFDEEALGYTLVNQWTASTPFNAAGGYSNTYWHETARYWNDFTEKGIVLLFD